MSKLRLLTLLSLLFFSANAFAADYDDSDYAVVLAAHVDESGMVDYAALKANREPLDRYQQTLAEVDSSVYNSWSDEAKIAFWVNAYNALTLAVIIDNYPIQSSFFKSLFHPDNSIRQISGVWTEITFPVMGTDWTLDQIEHTILRQQFQEARIHMALVCAAMSCPPLRTEPYTGDRLDAQLDDQTDQFLNHSKKFRTDTEERKVYLSKIFDWFGQDFIPIYGTDEQFTKFGEKERAVLNFISQYLPEDDHSYLQTVDFDISYLDYDWTLNEQTE